jgi:Glyoxalase-like domain
VRASLSPRIDHLVYVTADVARTMRDLAEALGVEPSAGGRHPAWGTRNALLALGPRSYLEIMGPEPNLSKPGLVRPFGIDQVVHAHLATWVVQSEDLGAIVAAGRKAGVEMGAILSGSRTRADGSVLSWSMTDLMAHREGGVVPYFIDWGHSSHPAESAPQGCTLVELKAVHPDPPRIRSILGALGLDLSVDRGPEFHLKGLVQSKKGLVELD